MIRDFRPEDREDFIRLCEEFYNTDAVLHSVPSEYFERSFDLALTENPYLRGLIFESKGRTVGYALLCFTYSTEVGGLVVWMEEAYIQSDARGQGLGRDLFAFVEKEYGGKAGRFRLEVTRSNTDAIRLYKRMGFEEMDYLQMIREL